MKYAYFLIAFVFLVSCKTKKISTNNVQDFDNKNELIENKAFTIQNFTSLNKEDLLFSIKEARIVNEQLFVNLQYGGGCVKPHVFELVTNGLINERGNMSFYVLHKTHNDNCKALLMEEKVFNLSELYNLKSELLKTITINEMKELPLH